MRVNLGDKKTKCKSCGLWTPAGKKCMWCQSELTERAQIQIKCQRCERVTYVERSNMYMKNRCAWCGDDISVIK